MGGSIMNLLITVVVGVAVAVIVLRSLFKGSIFLRIGSIWILNIFLVVINSSIHYNNKESYSFVFTLIVGLSLTSVLLFSVYRSVKKPLNYLVNKVNRIANGNLNVSEKEDLTQYKGELKTLNDSVDILATKTKEVISKLTFTSQSVNKMGGALHGVADDLASGNSEQAASIEEVSSSMEEMNANIEATNFNAGKTKVLTEQSNHELTQSHKISLELVAAMNVIADKINLIDEIASKTNLLALNASIEAKQAGEAGRGFNVVASEVRNLAEVSKKSSDEIRQLTENCKRLSETVNNSLNTAVPTMLKTVEMMQEISTASQELKQGSDQVTTAINEINRITQSAANMSEKLADGAGELSNESKMLLSQIDYFKI